MCNKQLKTWKVLCAGLNSLVCVKSPRSLLPRWFGFSTQQLVNQYILLDVLLCSIAEYFYELCRILASP